MSEMWLWEPTLLLRWRQAEPAHAIVKTLVLEQLWRGRRGHLFDADFEIREEWREVPVVEERA